MIWEFIYSFLIWVVLVLVSSTALIVWALWRLLLPSQLRWRVRSYYYGVRRGIHDFAANNLLLRPAYLKANVTWHSRISWKPKFYWRKLVSALRQDIKQSTISRAIGLKITSALWIMALYFFLNDPSYFPSVSRFLGNLKSTTDAIPQIRLDGTFFLTLLGLPLLFLLWAYRDTNSLLTIENQRKDTNLKEFQQLQMWACGVVKDVPDSEEGESQRTTLRITALHQLSRFLDGEYGDSFVQPTFEMLKALLEPNSAFSRKLKRELETYENGDSQFNGLGRGEAISLATQEVLDSFALPHWALHVQRILLKGGARFGLGKLDWSNTCISSVELRSLFAPNVDLSGTEIRGVYLFSSDLPQANLSFAEMQGARIVNCDLQGADLDYADLTGASFVNARLQGASMSHSVLQGASFRGGMFVSVRLDKSDAKYTVWKRADLRGASLFEADLSGASLIDARLNGADFSRTKLDGADLRGISWDQATLFAKATYDGATLFGEWDEIDKKWTNSESVRKKLELLGLQSRVTGSD